MLHWSHYNYIMVADYLGSLHTSYSCYLYHLHDLSDSRDLLHSSYLNYYDVHPFFPFCVSFMYPQFVEEADFIKYSFLLEGVIYCLLVVSFPTVETPPKPTGNLLKKFFSSL